MVLEATMVIVDNSEPSRNGDYTATRWQAQIDAVGVIVSAKIRANPQSAVGLMSMGGNGPEVLSTFTDDFGKILSGLHRTKIHGKSHLASSIQVAGLALKHRSEKAQRQRIIVFSCAPVTEDEKSLIKLAKRMKKNNVSIDVVAFGDLDSDTTKKLEAFVENVKGGDGSHLAIIPPARTYSARSSWLLQLWAASLAPVLAVETKVVMDSGSKTPRRTIPSLLLLCDCRWRKRRTGRRRKGENVKSRKVNLRWRIFPKKPRTAASHPRIMIRWTLFRRTS
ncbi:proteasome regulatory particle base subunit rpn10 [Talaromyces marneffei ATCC 18224]